LRRRATSLPDDHPLRCSQCPRQRRVVVPEPLCSRCLARLLRSTPPDADLWLPEDGIVDDIAVETLTKGLRPWPIKATRREYLLAAANLMTQDHDKPVELVTSRMHVSYVMAWQLVNEIRKQGIPDATSRVPVSDMSTTNAS
jgi:hypothetical protein